MSLRMWGTIQRTALFLLKCLEQSEQCGFAGIQIGMKRPAAADAQQVSKLSTVVCTKRPAAAQLELYAPS